MTPSLLFRRLLWLTATGLVVAIAVLWGASRKLFSPRRGLQLGLLTAATSLTWLSV